MSFSSNKTKQKAQQSSSGTSTTTVDPWSKAQFENQTSGIMDTAQGILGRTQQYTDKPFRAYGGPMVADMSAGEQQAMSMAQAGSGAGGVLDDAVTAAKAGGSQTWTPEGVLGPDKVDYETFDPSKLDARMNPYKDKVVAAQEAYFDEQLAKRKMANQADAASKGAWGARYEVGNAELDRTSNMDRNQLVADLNYRGWNDAVAGDERERNTTYGARVRNSDVGYQARMNDAQRKDAAAQFGIGQKFQEAGILGSLAGQKNATFGQQFDMLAKAGATAREIDQAKILASRAEFDREAKDELDKLMLELQARQAYQQTQQGILASTPMGQTTTSSGTGQSSGTTSGTTFGASASFGPKGFSFGG
jgi:hypothetical protein